MEASCVFGELSQSAFGVHRGACVISGDGEDGDERTVSDSL